MASGARSGAIETTVVRRGSLVGPALFAAALLVNLPALRHFAWLDPGSRERGELVPWALRWLVAPLPASAKGILALRLLLCAAIAFGGARLCSAARRFGAGGFAAFAAGLAFVAASATGSVLWDASGRPLLLINLLWFVAVDRWLAEKGRVTAAALWAVLSAGIVSAVLLSVGLAWPIGLAGGASVAGAPGLVTLGGEAVQSGLGFLWPRPFLAAGVTSLVPLAVLIPAVAAIACALALLMRAAFLVAAVGLLVVQVVPFGGGGDVRVVLRGAMPNARAAELLSALDESTAPLEEAVVAAHASPSASLPSEVEQRLGFAAADHLERDGDEEGALAWLNRWLAARATHPSLDALPQLHARRIALELKLRGPEAAATTLTDESARLGHDRGYVGAVAAVMVDALCRSARDPRFVATVLPLIERLLEPAAASPESATCDELCCLALLRAGEARFVDAVKLAELATRRDPRSARPHVVLARIYHGRGEREAALGELALARNIDARDPSARLLRGRILCGSADFARQGVDELLGALATAPALPGAREELDDGLAAATTVLIGRDQSDVAEQLLERAVAAVGRRAALVHQLGKVAARRREFEAAVALLEEAFAAAPSAAELAKDLAEALRGAGYARLLAGDRTAAAQKFERAIEVAPADVDTTAMKAVVESWQARGGPEHEQAVAAARAAFDDGTRLYAAGDKEAACHALARSIELLPQNPLAYVNLGRIELELGRPKEAEGSLRTAIALGLELQIDVEDAWPFLVRALMEQKDDAAKVGAAIDDYLARHPRGRHAESLRKLREGGP